MLARHLLTLNFIASTLATPKLLICGDSTTADYASSSALQGWGYFLKEYMDVTVVNKAKNGRSTRSFIREGLWQQLLSDASPGDFIVIEMGHNDMADPSSKNTNVDKASRGVIRGTGNQTLEGQLKNGRTETVYTYGHYLRTMIRDVQAKQAIPLISGMVPRNSFDGTTFRKNWPWARDAETVAREQKVEFINHTKYTAARFQQMGPAAVKELYPRDSTHTSQAGARLNTETFVVALRCAKSVAAAHIGPKGRALMQEC